MPTTSSKKRRVESPPPKSPVSSDSEAEADASEASDASDASEVPEAKARRQEAVVSSDSSDSEVEAAAASVQSCKELDTRPAQGGGAKGALREMLDEEESGVFSHEVFEDELGNVNRVVYHPSPGKDVVLERPDKDCDDEWPLWRLMEKGRLAMKVNDELLGDLRKLANAVEPYRDEPPPPLVVNKQGKVVARADHDNRQHTMPEHIQWKLRSLPTALAEAIEDKYFLDIDETVVDKNGDKYHPKDVGTGSMCAATGFPHAIAYTKAKGRGKTKPVVEYIVAACNKVKLTVRLKKRDKSGVAVDVSSDELLQMLAPHRNTHRVHGDTETDYEQDMMLYLALEFADGDNNFARVPPSSFVQEPVLGALFAPAESAPYKGGHCEWPMKNGVGIIDFRIAKGVTTSALKKAHKGRKFRFVVKALNPFFCGLKGFTTRSRAFCIKGVLHNDVKSQERYVETSEGVVASLDADVSGKDE